MAFSSLAVVGCAPGGETDGNGSSSGGNTTTSTTDTTSTETTSSTEPCTSDDKAIKLGKLVNPKDGSVLENAIVVVHDGRISYVGTDAATIPCGAEVIDWTAYTGLPGLIDVHTHFAYLTDDEPGTYPWQRSLWLALNAPDVLMDLARKAARATVKTGVTTVVDKGAGSEEWLLTKLQEETAVGRTQGPRVFHAGQGIWWQQGVDATGIKLKVQQQVMAGANLIKIWADNCSDDTLACTPNFTQEELTAAVDEAHLLGTPIAIHAYHGDTAKLAILAGPDTVEHPEGIGSTDFTNMIAKNVIYVPTIDHNRYYKENIHYFGYHPGLAAELDAYIQLNLETAGQAHEDGVKIAMGSDAVFSGFGQNTRELGWLIQAGMTPLEAIRAATIHGAESIGVQGEIGNVEVGYHADIIAVEGDPLADINAVIEGVRGVMKGGQVMDLE